MTCIAGLVHLGKVYMMADSGAWNGAETFVVASPAKLLRRGGWGMGFAGDNAILQSLRRMPNLPPPVADDSDSDALALGELAAWVGSCAAESKAAEWSVMMGARGRIYTFGNDGTSGERSVWPYQAIGSGSAWAQGALSALPHGGPWVRLRTALEAAERHCAYIRRPFRRIVV